MFYVIESILFCFCTVWFVLPSVCRSTIRQPVPAELVLAALTAFFFGNIAVTVALCLRKGRTPLLIYQKLSRPTAWPSFVGKYCGAVTLVTMTIAFLFYLFRVRLSDAPCYPQNGLWPFSVAAGIVLAFAFSLLFATFWAKGRFPMEDPECVYYTMGNATAHSDPSIFREATIVCLWGIVIAILAIVIPALVARKLNAKSMTVFFGQRTLFLPIAYVHLTASLLFLLYVLISVFLLLHGNAYVRLIYNDCIQPVASDFYEQEYSTPRFECVSFPEKKRNLIMIIAESLESSYASIDAGGMFNTNLIPELTELAREHVNFSHTERLGGGEDVSGTSWTVGALTAKFSGLPYHLPPSSVHDDYFLPNAVTLTDILNHAGYEQRFLFGSDKTFGRRHLLLETHGAVTVHDINWYKAHNMLDNSYHVFWGFEDSKLYEFAQHEAADLAATGKPFMLGLLTVDTHMPEGYLCERCPTDEPWQMKNVIRCADRQLAAFVRWAQTQDWYTDTAIVIMGDHCFMTGDSTDFLAAENPGSAAYKRRWLDIFINAQPAIAPAPQRYRNRAFSSFDMFPTTLAAMGCTIQDDRLGFGTNLFSNTATVLERYGRETVDASLKVKNTQYRALAGK
ncbi:MAG: sulfatase-like hydrolase/transferase [Treponema sp.]|nr:sulfatase-like hydrolase/transferase [Treponema sp.]